jgi:hypothetical protein
MTITNSSLVNQKLAFSQALLSMASGIDSACRGSERLQRRALIDAAVAQLACAHRHYLRELVESCGVKPMQSMETEEGINEHLANLGKNSVEIEELLQLRRQRTSWLGRVLNCYGDQWSMPLPIPKVQPITDASLINVIEICDEPESAVVTLDEVEVWHQLFKELVQRQREISAEY